MIIYTTIAGMYYGIYIYIYIYIYRFVLFLQPLDYNSLKLDRHLADHSTRPIIALIA